MLLALDGGPNCNAALDCSGDSDSARSQCTQTTDKPASCSGTGPIKNCCDGNSKGCLDAMRVIDAVKSLRTSGVVTLVVGIPGSEAYATVLDELAEHGGAPASSSSPKYFRVTDPAGLTATLRSLTLDLVRSCELALESSPPDRNLVNVFLDGTVVPQEGADGWELDASTNPPTIRLKGETCRRIETSGAESISVEFGCPTIKVPL